MSMRLLRPLHPFVAFAASHLAAVPFRSARRAADRGRSCCVSSGASALTTEPLQLALLVPSLALAWLITFSIMFALGCARVLRDASRWRCSTSTSCCSRCSRATCCRSRCCRRGSRERRGVLPFRFMLERAGRADDAHARPATQLADAHGRPARVGGRARSLLALWVWRARRAALRGGRRMMRATSACSLVQLRISAAAGMAYRADFLLEGADGARLDRR